MSRGGIGRRLDALEEPEVPSRAEYLDARRRAMAHTLRSFGAELEPDEEHDLGAGYDEDDFAIDCDVLTRYRASLDPEKRKREQHGLMGRLYTELERRGINRWEDEREREVLE